MGLISAAYQERAATSGIQNPSNWLFDALGGSKTASGKRVDVDTAMTLSAVWAAIRLLSESAASLPLVTYERLQPRGKRRKPDHPAFSVLHDNTTERQTAFEWVETTMAHLCLRGNSWSWIERDNASRVTALWILDPRHMKVFPLPGGDILFSWEPPDVPPLRALAGSGDMLHVRGFNAGNGLLGVSPITFARESLGVGLAAEEYGARFFSNSTTPSGVLEHPKELSDAGIQRLTASLNNFRSLENKHKNLILEEGMQWKTIGVSPEDAQMLETRKFQVSEVARWFRVPPHMIADLEKATFSNIESQGMDFIRHTMRPWLIRIEKSIQRDVLLPKERRTIFVEFLVDALLRGDSETRSKSYASGRQWGYLSVNDIREMENQNPIEGGDEYLTPLNMVGSGSDGGTEPPPPAPAPTASRSAEDPERAAHEARELRSARSLKLRKSIGEAMRPVFRDAARSIVRAEKRKLSKAIAGVTEGDTGVEKLGAIIERYYESEGDLSTFAFKQIDPAYRALGESIAPVALDEAESDVEKDLEPLCESLARSFAERHAAESRRRLQAVMADNQRDTEAMRAALDSELENWDEVRTETIARVETVKSKSAIARTIFIAAGVLQIRWVTFGENCPICDSLSGKVVGVEHNFAGQGTEVGPEGASIKTRTNITHPPIHDGCDCDITVA